MRKNDIRFSKEAATIEHHSARGRVVRNSGDFTRGSQLFSHEMMMTWAGIRVPLLTWFFASLTMLSVIGFFYFREHELQLVLMKMFAELWNWVALNPDKIVNLTLPDGSVKVGHMSWVPFHPAVEAAWARAVKLAGAAAVGSIFLCLPFTIWFVGYSRKKGGDILKERHERGALLITQPELKNEVILHNRAEFQKECARHKPPLDPNAVLKHSMKDRVRAGIHVPYQLAGLPFPWRLEQSHAMLLGTTGSGKTTAMKPLVSQARARGHRCVIFDLTGSFVESFYNPTTDVILNTMDRRCEPWTIFEDCDNYAEFLSASNALIPSGPTDDDFWQKAARTLFVEMCMKLVSQGLTSNGALAHHLMHAKLQDISDQLEGTVAAPLVATSAAKMAESIRATFNTHANALRFIPDPVGDQKPFSINRWMADESKDGSILFITSNYSDLALNRELLTLWMDIAVQSIFRLGRTKSMRTWYLFDEVHALHRLPAIEHGLQTARAVGGAFVLGIHSFNKLEETYGHNGAVHLASLARTKLILTTPDIETAERCSDFIGSREVRQMDEAYSYGYNNTRDASTITPRKEVQHLVMPDDIKELPSLHGFIKFPDGFPAAKIKLEIVDYPEVANGFERIAVMRAAEYVPEPDDELDEHGTGGHESERAGTEAETETGQGQDQLHKDDPGIPAEPSQLENDTNLAGNAAGQSQAASITSTTPSSDPNGAGAARAASAGLDDLFARLREKAEDTDNRDQQRGAGPADQTGKNPTTRTDRTSPEAASRRWDQESLIMREERLGIGIEQTGKDTPDISDDFEAGI